MPWSLEVFEGQHPFFCYAKVIQDIFNAVKHSNGPPNTYIERTNRNFKLDAYQTYGEIEATYFTLEDASFVFGDVDRNKLCAPNLQDNHHGVYIRLYGFLSSVYMIRQAILHYMTLAKYPNKKSALIKIDESELIDARHAIVAHPLNAQDDSEGRSNNQRQVRLVQVSLCTPQIMFVNEETSQILDLNKDIKNFYRLTFEALNLTIEHSINHWTRSNIRKRELLEFSRNTHLICSNYLNDYTYGSNNSISIL